jgi:hypothetical protein
LSHLSPFGCNKVTTTSVKEVFVIPI